MRLLRKKATFIPYFMRDKYRTIKEDAEPVHGVVTYVNRKHGWFCVSYRAGNTIQREGFKFCDIGEVVTVHG